VVAKGFDNPRVIARNRIPLQEPSQKLSAQSTSRPARPDDRGGHRRRRLDNQALGSIEALHPLLALIHVFLTTRAIITPGCAGMACSTRVPDQAAFIPSYCPHLNPIERLWAHAQKRRATNATRLAPNSPMRRLLPS
jgi:hypothetical protein